MKTTWIKMWSDRPYSLHLMSMANEATVFGFKKVFPESEISQGFNYWENGKSSYFYPTQELSGTTRRLAGKSLKSPKFLLDFLEDVYRRAVHLRKFSEKFKRIDPKKLSSKKLAELIEGYSKEFHDFYARATIAPLLGYQDDNPIYQKMDELIRSKTKNHPEKYSDYYTALTSSPKKLKNNLMEIEILKLAGKAKGSKLRNERKLVKRFKKEIGGIKNKYEFLSFDFCDSVSWDLDHFADLVMEKMKLDISFELRRLLNLEKTSGKNFQKSVRELKLSKKEIEICTLVKYLGYQKWAREHEFQEAQYNLKPVQDELGSRAGLSTLESKYLLANEYRELATGPEKYKKLTRARIKNSLCFVKVDKKTKVFIGREAKKIFAGMEKEEPAKIVQTTELKGMPAFPGKISGKVKIIITAKDAGKMKKGDILVSQATGPDLVPAMKMAAAIVTNEGGITAHAAIVSRELKIPCIVGTKIATKVLQDGNLVEVDADRGIVKIIFAKGGSASGGKKVK
ncbi:MAG: hypothetical protein A3J76_02355 [Candidatus Moranbacteria bacterium RBG_13_45_13]|nr:MAG: hypothetical protein A3J76_02355 [Candidatus Moranbacteria bacterium RBG_13_45_13]